MVYTKYDISFNFHFPCKLYTLELAHATFLACIRCYDTKGVMEHFNFMHKRTLRMYDLEKFFNTQEIRLDEYAVMPNVNYKFIV